MTDIIITYETLFDMFRREKEREELQKLDENFFENVVEYIKSKKKVIEDQQATLFAAEEKKKAEKQLDSIKKILKDLYDKREKKIINLAIDKSRTQSDIVDTSHMLPVEKEFFTQIVELLDKSRSNILYSIMEAKLPEKITQAIRLEDIENIIPEPENVLVRFIHAVPRFVGPLLEQHGPFEADDIANLPREIANVLINKGRAEEIKEK